MEKDLKFYIMMKEKKYETHYDYFVDKFNAKNICHYYQKKNKATM